MKHVALLAVLTAAVAAIFLTPRTGRPNPYTTKMKKVMRELKKGTLYTPQGYKVTTRKQAVAIALNEVRRGRK